MQKKMVFQICLFTESSMAHVTLKWPGSSVHVCVRFEIAWSWKGFGTHCAFMWLLLKIKGKGELYLIYLSSFYEILRLQPCNFGRHHYL